jgi:SAM-dependent methyltransferase
MLWQSGHNFSDAQETPHRAARCSTDGLDKLADQERGWTRGPVRHDVREPSSSSFMKLKSFKSGDRVEKAPGTYREVWERKPALREVYGDIYRRMAAATVPGPTLEIGGGSGNFKDFAPNVISSDILWAPQLDLICDAQRLPFTDASFANIVMVDVLHHVGSPLCFFQEAQRTLQPGGRLIFCEPAITPLSGLFYRMFHDEPVDMAADPLAAVSISVDKDPYEANQAIPTLLLGLYRAALARAVPGLKLHSVDRLSFLAWPLSGGFQPWSLLPTAVARPLLKIEWLSHGLFGRLAAFRLIAVYRKVPAAASQP